MNKDKEPLLDVHQFYQNDMSMDIFEMMEKYAKYHTKWHLRQCGEIVCEEARATSTCTNWNCYGESADKQSITNAVDKYINENLKK